MSVISVISLTFINKIFCYLKYRVLEVNEFGDVEVKLCELLHDAMKIIKNEINSDDPNRRLKAAIAIMELNHK